MLAVAEIPGVAFQNRGYAQLQRFPCNPVPAIGYCQRLKLGRELIP